MKQYSDTCSKELGDDKPFNKRKHTRKRIIHRQKAAARQEAKKKIETDFTN